MERVLEQIEKYVLYATVFLFPFFVIPISPNPFVVPKLAILTFGVILLLLVKSLRIILGGKLEFTAGNFDLPVVILAVIYIISTVLRSDNIMEALLLPGTTTVVVGGAFLYFLANQLKIEGKTGIMVSLLASGAVFSLLTLIGLDSRLLQNSVLPAVYKSAGFTPEGGYVPAIMFLVVLIPLAVELFMSQKDIVKKTLVAVSGGVIALALIASVYNILPGKVYSPKFPSFSTSWSVAVDTLKISPFWGIGPGNYLTAFSRFRPVSYNQTDLWAIKFATARSFYLTNLTETGILGTIALAAVLFAIYTMFKKSIKDSPSYSLVSLVILVVALVFLPASSLIIGLLFLLLALNATTKHTTLNLSAAEGTGIPKLPFLLITIPVIALSLYLGYNGGKILIAEYRFQKAVDFLGKSDAAKTYDYMRSAISLNSKVDRYHSTFARVNLALASSLAQKKDVSDADKSSISTLIQQSINESKATVILNKNRSSSWEQLARTYQVIMPFAKGADQYAIQTYAQAVALDPTNPALRINFGGVYYALGKYDDAIETFKLAVLAKPDLANAHYNLAIAYREKKDYDNAISQMNAVLSLVKKDSKDYTLAQTELANLQKNKPTKTVAGTENLTPPQPAETSNIKPPIQLSEEANPPQPVVSASPTPTLTPSPNP